MKDGAAFTIILLAIIVTLAVITATAAVANQPDYFVTTDHVTNFPWSLLAKEKQ